MPNVQFQLQLQPVKKGAWTRVHLSGAVMTALPACELAHWVDQLARWSNLPVELALPVDAATDGWFESWTSLICELPAHHLHVRFILLDQKTHGVDDE